MPDPRFVNNWITDEKKDEIWEAYKANPDLTMQQLADQFEMKMHTVSAIVSNRLRKYTAVKNPGFKS